MAIDYAAKAATARRLLEKFGQVGKLIRTITAGGSPVTGGGTVTTTETDLLMAVLPAQGTFRDLPGSLLKAGDYTVYTEAVAGLTITTTDRIECSTGKLLIIEAIPFAPAGEIVFWTLTGRRAA